MQGMDKLQLQQEIDRRIAVRKDAEKKIEELSKERNEYLKAHGKSDGFDAKVKATVEKQLKK